MTTTRVLALAAVVLLCVVCSDDPQSGQPDSGQPDDGGTPVDAGAPPCEAGSWTCSKDAHVLRRCVGGAWREVRCMADQGRLCEQGACVDPWRYGSPAWPTCSDEPLATKESLAEKAAAYDAIAERLHLHPKLKRIASVDLFKQEVACPPGATPPCYAPTVDPAQATPADVERWHSGENDGLWNALYMASQAYRHAASRSPQALSNLRLTMEGERDRMAITGVPGLFTRQLIPPGVAGLACPADDAKYAVDKEKDDNRWVKIKDDGCVWVVEDGAWKATKHCGLEAFAGYCWLDNVSQDEYTGHMYALGLIWQLVDDDRIKRDAAELLEQVGRHLVQNNLTLVDWDGRVVEHGRLYATAFIVPPGFGAALAMDFVLMAAVASGREDLGDFYNSCLLQLRGPSKCLPWPLEQPRPYTEYLTDPDLLLAFPGTDGCLSNFNGHSMMGSAMFSLVGFERDPARRRLVQDTFDLYMMRADSPKAGIKQHNSWYDFMWAAHKRLGPGSDGPDHAAVEDGICMLRQFPARKTEPDMSSEALYRHYCDGRLKNSLAREAIPVAHRCPTTFTWWSRAFRRESCTRKDWVIHAPTDYLLAYWMGRYYGFIPPEL
jgi:hypothetical protein